VLVGCPGAAQVTPQIQAYALSDPRHEGRLYFEQRCGGHIGRYFILNSDMRTQSPAVLGRQFLRADQLNQPGVSRNELIRIHIDGHSAAD